MKKWKIKAVLDILNGLHLSCCFSCMDCLVKQDNAEKFETSRAAIAEDPSFGAYNGVKAGSQGYAIGKGDVYEK